MLNLPLTSKDVKNIISPSIKSKTNLEECVIRGLFDKENDAMMTLRKTGAHGWDMQKLKDLADEMVKNKCLTEIVSC